MILGMHFFKQVSVKTNCILVFNLNKHIQNKQKYYNWWIIFFLEKQLFKQGDSSTDSGALTGGIVTISIVLLAVGIIVAIYRK